MLGLEDLTEPLLAIKNKGEIMEMYSLDPLFSVLHSEFFFLDAV